MFCTNFDDAERLINNFHPTLSFAVASLEEAEAFVEVHHESIDVEVDVPSIRLGSASRLLNLLIPLVQDQNWIVDSAYLIYGLVLAQDKLDKASRLLQMCIDDIVMAVEHYDSMLGGAHKTELQFADPPELPNNASLQQVVKAIHPALFQAAGDWTTSSGKKLALAQARNNARALLWGRRMRRKFPPPGIRPRFNIIRTEIRDACIFTGSTSMAEACHELAYCCGLLQDVLGLRSAKDVHIGHHHEDEWAAVQVGDVETIQRRLCRLQGQYVLVGRFKHTLDRIRTADTAVSFDEKARKARLRDQQQRFKSNAYDQGNDNWYGNGVLKYGRRPDQW